MKRFKLTKLIRIPKRSIGYFKLAEEQSLTNKDPQLMVSEKFGFLPREIPLFDIPESFRKVDELLKAAPIIKEDGSSGLLAHGKFADAVVKDLPLYDASKIEDTRLLEALMRDYTYLASMYILEPCDISFRKTGDYGLGRDRLPSNIAVPLCQIAKKLNIKPFLEYTQYVVYNWTKKDPTKDMSPENLTSPRCFEGSPDEFWFKAVHLYMLQQSGKLLKHSYELFRACEAKDRVKFDEALTNLLKNSQIINRNMDTMWKGSNPKKYIGFRTFILGILNQPMFPNGVVYQGVSEEGRAYRGESGANDSMIPTLDNVLEVTSQMPENPLTEVLRDFRTYRPANHQQFLAWAESKARELGVRKFACEDSNSTVLYLANLDQIAEFRERHWRFTKEYIIKNSTHPVATGGSPITTWLPNQLGVVLELIENVGTHVDKSKLSGENLKMQAELVKRAALMRSILLREVTELKSKFVGQDL